ncbi:hypothetical protein O0L34_g15152 [Tuta absoluta]|nr:hypothetical protein O0L34_g15152 [Tuta absoluta]
MRIRQFAPFVENENLKDYVLKNAAVVVDAQNFFYNLYQESGYLYAFGCESDKYADYLRSYLSMFKKANIKCYFIFKGGHKEYMKRLKIFDDYDVYHNYNINEEYKDIVLPIFMKDVYKQILDEMGFDYTICEYEAKRDCIALARKLQCPVVSTDIEFCFSGLSYIMQSTLEFDERSNSIKCGIFSLDAFLQKYRLTEEKLALFITLTNEKDFPENHFLDFVKSLRIPLGYYKRNPGILAWLSRTTRTKALDYIFRYINKEDKDEFLRIERKNWEFIRRKEIPGIPTEYLENGSKIDIIDKDPFWFQKGVASKHIPLQIINLARFEVFEGSWAIADYTQDDPRMIALDIIKYTYNLLTNFEKDELTLYIKNKIYPVCLRESISKPSYDEINSPFENGWKNLKGELFKHFLDELFQGFDFEMIQKLPEDLRMIMIALIYFSVKKPTHTRNEVCSVLLSYVALSQAKTNNNVQNNQQIAKCVMKKFLYVSKDEAKRIFDIKMLHPLVEFQHCLQSLNNLNVLCGKLYKPTIYSNTFNATLVYKTLYTIEKKYDGDCMQFLNQELNSAPTVLSYIRHLMEIYDAFMENM